jgi:hypothetical protein
MSQLNFSGQLNYKGNSVKVRLGMYLFKDGEAHIVYCPALDLSAYGDSEEQAKQSFADILGMTIKYMLNKRTMKDDLTKHGWQIKSLKQNKIKAPSFETMLKNNDSFREILEREEYMKYEQDINIPSFA